MSTPSTLTELINLLSSLIVGTVLPIAMGLCVLFFLWGGFQMIVNANNPDKLKEGRSRLLWSVLAMFVVISLGAIVQLVAGTFVDI